MCVPTPLTGTWACAPGYQCAGAPSTVHEMPSTPDGPAPAVAVTYWVPAVAGASARARQRDRRLLVVDVDGLAVADRVAGRV